MFLEYFYCIWFTYCLSLWRLSVPIGYTNRLFCVCFRGEAAQVPGLRQSLQPVFEPHHAQPQAHRLQAIRVRPLRQSLPEEGGPAAPQGDSTHGVEAGHVVAALRGPGSLFLFISSGGGVVNLHRRGAAAAAAATAGTSYGRRRLRKLSSVQGTLTGGG